MLTVQGLRKVFGGLVAVEDVSFDVPKGSISALIGPNGAGKTTVFHMISGVHQPTAGSVRLDGGVITGLPPHRICEKGIGRTFQAVQIFREMSLVENVMVGGHRLGRAGMLTAGLRLPWVRHEEERIRHRAFELLALVGLADDPALPAASLPFGKQRLLEIARALAAEPKLLVLDEPASGLNTVETEAIGQLIRRIRDQGITVLLVEHDMRLVMELAELVIVMDRGRIIAQGPPAKIQADPVVIEAYLGSRRR